MKSGLDLDEWLLGGCISMHDILVCCKSCLSQLMTRLRATVAKNFRISSIGTTLGWRYEHEAYTLAVAECLRS